MTARKIIVRVVLGLSIFVIGAASGYTLGGDLRTVAVVPLYGAGAAPSAGEPAGDNTVQPDWAKRLEAKLDRILKVIEELDEKTPDPAVAATNEELFFRGDLTAADRARMVKKIKRTGDDRMPPPSAEQLTAPEKEALIAAFSGQQADPSLVGTAGVKCSGCHAPAVAQRKGEGFVMFETKAKK